MTSRPVRLAFGLIVGLLLTLLGVEQTISDVLVRDAAQPHSLVAYLPFRVDERWPLLPLQRLLLAKRDLAAGYLQGAEHEVTLLPRSPDRLDLEAQLAQRRGDRATAIAMYSAADNVGKLEAIVTRMQRSGDIRQALSLQQGIIRQLETNGMQLNALADAWWHLGWLLSDLGDETPPERTKDYRAAMAAYEHAVALAPFSQKYLLNAASTAMNLGELERAKTLYNRVRSVNPNSADALHGQQQIASLRDTFEITPVNGGISLAGDGWYPFERFGGDTFRWVHHSAEVLVDTAHTSASSVRFDVQPGPGVAGSMLDLQITDRTTGRTVSQQIAGRQEISFKLSGSSARHDLVLQAMNGGKTTTKDPLILDFRVFNITSSTNMPR